MGYRVEYETAGNTGTQRKSDTRHIPGLTAAFLLLFVLLVHGFWPRGREVLRELILPGDATVTAAALEGFALDLRMGQPLGEAVEGFCREVIADAGLGKD